MDIALITGANKGIGFAAARQLAQNGVKVILGSRDFSKGEEAAEMLRKDGFDVEVVTIDVCSEPSIRAVATQIEKEHGRLDILINNAGISAEGAAGKIPALPEADMFRETFATNVVGAVSVIEQFLPLLRRSPAGRIVNVSSTMGSLADQSNPSSNFYGVIAPAYQASKAALNVITIALAKSLKDTDIKVNSICPGWVRTDTGGPDAPRTADEGARIIVKMASISADGPTGGFFDDAGDVPW